MLYFYFLSFFVFMFVNWRKYRDNCRKNDNDYQIFFCFVFFSLTLQVGYIENR